MADPDLEHPLWNYRAKLDRVVDGDTIDFIVDLGFGLSKRERVRVAGIDTPEIRGEERPDGLRAREFVVKALPTEDWIYLTTEKERGKYGRYIAHIWVFDAEGIWHNLAEDLLDAGLAERVEY